MVRSERMFCEQLDYNLLFRWFGDQELDERSFNQSTFSRKRAVLTHEVAVSSSTGGGAARAPKLLSSEHFTVRRRPNRAMASLKSFNRKDRGDPPDDPGNTTVNSEWGDRNRWHRHEHGRCGECWGALATQRADAVGSS